MHSSLLRLRPPENELPLLKRLILFRAEESPFLQGGGVTEYVERTSPRFPVARDRQYQRQVPKALIQLPPDYRTYREPPPGYRRVPYGQVKKNWSNWEKSKYWEHDEYWRQGSQVGNMVDQVPSTRKNRGTVMVNQGLSTRRNRGRKNRATGTRRARSKIWLSTSITFPTPGKKMAWILDCRPLERSLSQQCLSWSSGI
jgi:hypothetical protein